MTGSGTGTAERWSWWRRWYDSYVHARYDCAYGVVMSAWKATYFETTGRWPS